MAHVEPGEYVPHCAPRSEMAFAKGTFAAAVQRSSVPVPPVAQPRPSQDRDA